MSSILIYNTHRWQYNIKGDVKRMNRWFVYINKKEYCLYCFYFFFFFFFFFFSLLQFYFFITVFDETDLLFALSFSFFMKVDSIWLWMQIFFFQCILNVSISPSRSTSKNAEHKQEKERKPCERKKIKMSFGWMILEIKKKIFLILSIHDLIIRKIFLIKIKNSRLAFGIWTSK